MIIHFNDTLNQTLDIAVNDDSYRYRAIKGEHALTLHFSLVQHVEIPVGAWVEFEGEYYELEKPSNFKKKSARNFEYTLVMEAAQAKLKKYKFRNTVDKRLEFPYTARPHEHLQMLVDNMNMRESGWRAGDCIDAVEKLISYNHAFCIDALGQMADEFNTEYEIVGKTIHLRKLEYNKDNPLPLSYGRGNGFRPGVGRSNFGDSKPVEVLFVQGGEDNIDPSKYGNKSLLLPRNSLLRFDGTHFEDEPGFNSAIARSYITDTDGLSIRRADKELQTKEEDSLDCSHIYPKRVGTVSDVQIVNAAKNFYDIIDNSIPTDLDYNTCLMAGETMTVIFQSGMLAGREWEVKYYHEAKSGKAARRFEIVPQDMDGQTMPNDTFKPMVGDTYAVFHIALPDAYVCNDASKTGASWDMFRESVKYFYDNEEQKFSFTGELDGIWAKQDWNNIGGRIRLGGYVFFSDAQFQTEGVAIRIVGIKDFINNPHSPEIELSNETVSNSFISQLNKIEETEVVVDDQYRKSLQFTKRRFRDSLETIEMLRDAMLENFTSSINPITVQTMAALIGDESLQFRFVDNKNNPVTLLHEVSYNNETRVLTIPAGIIQHMTLGIDTISSSHAINEYHFWDIPEFTSPPLDDDKRYYLYIKVSETDSNGEFYISEKPIPMESVSGYYHLWMGVLNSTFGGARSYTSMYGFTELLPGRITTDKIISSDGKTYFDLSRGEIGGNIVLSASQDYKEIADGIKELKTDVDSVKNQSDKEYTIWFEKYEPTLNNLPASQWTTDEIKELHDQDMLYNSETGFAYRFEQSEDGSFAWNNITDHQTVKALETAAKAQDTADGKRRVFVSQPTPPYDVGDLWLTGGSADGELKKCITPRATGAYNADDWAVGVSYDNTKTVINGGLITSGTVQLASDDSNIKAGITGDGAADSSVRIWAGGSFANRSSAPFRVSQDGSMVAESGTIGGWSITETGIVSKEINQSSGNISGKSRTSLNSDGTIGGNLFSVTPSSGQIRCKLYDDPIMEWTPRNMKMNARVSIPFLTTNFGTRNGGDLFAQQLSTQLSYENSNFHIQSIYPVGEKSPGAGYFQLPINLDEYNGVTLRIFNDIEQSGSYKYNTACLVYNSTGSYIDNVNTESLRNFLGKFTGNKLLIPSGKMVVITGVPVQKASTTVYGKRELAWYVEVTA